MTFFEFAGNHPWCAFFLALITLSCIEGCVSAIANAFAKHPIVEETPEPEEEFEETEETK